MALPVYGNQILTRVNCKICQSEHRAEIEDFWTMGKRGHVQPTGELTSPTWITRNAPSRWGIQISPTNMRGHFKGGHFEPGDPKKPVDAVELPQDIKDAIDRGELEMVAPERYLETVVALGYQDLLANPGKVNHGLVIKAIDALTRRHHDETQAKLMQALGAGVAKALEQQQPQATLPSLEIEAEAVEVVEDVAPIPPTENREVDVP